MEYAEFTTITFTFIFLKDCLSRRCINVRLQEYRLLWLHLRSLSRDIFSSFFRAFLVYSIFITTCSIVCSYVVLLWFWNNGFNHKVGLFVSSLTMIFMNIYFSINRSQMLRDSVSNNRISCKNKALLLCINTL